MTSPSSSITRKDPSEKEGLRRTSDSSRLEEKSKDGEPSAADDLEMQLRGAPKVSKDEGEQAELEGGKPPKLV